MAGVKTDFKELDGLLGLVKTGIEQASRKRDNAPEQGVKEYFLYKILLIN